jgi:hypothetical protein
VISCLTLATLRVDLLDQSIGVLSIALRQKLDDGLKTALGIA